MSFNKIVFSYTPPPTALPQAIPGQPGTILPVTATSSKNDLAKASRAAALIDRLRALKATAQYLESLIAARCQGMGINPNYSVDPELGMALARLYSAPTPPTGIGLEMYNNLLAAEIGITRAEMALAGSSSPIKVSPMQKADLMKVTLAFEDAMAETGQFRHQLPLLMRELKNDELIFDSLVGSLQEYPVLNGSDYAAAPATATSTVIDNGEWMTPEQQSLASLIDTSKLQVKNATIATHSASEVTNALPDIPIFSASFNAGTPDPIFSTTDAVLIDVNMQTAAEVDARLDQYQKTMGAMYNLATGIDDAYNYVGQIANQYLVTDLNKLILVMSTLSGLILLFHKPKLKDIKGLIGMMIMPRLIAEVGQFNCLMDRVEQRLLAPVTEVLGSLNRLVGEVSQVSNDVAYLVAKGGMTGMMRSSISGSNKMPKQERIKALDTLPKEMALVQGHLAWGLMEASRKRRTVEDGMLKAMDRQLAGSGDRLDLMKSLRSINAVVDIIKNLILERQRGSLQSVDTPSPTQKVEAMSNIASNLKSESGTSFSVQGNMLVAQPPSLPAPPDAAVPILAAGGANRVDSADLIKIHMDAL